ncbi:hypothetical protein F7734_59810 [Scytonema sp. UIC 10036]|nr:hypothetical protein [Scytonema sp. UIC 10036]MUH01778.1 hypothetical protein [Scytonema sp. UIC 10036]
MIEKNEKTGLVEEHQSGIVCKKDFDYFINTPNKQLLIRNDNKIYLMNYKNKKILSTLVCSSKTIKGLAVTCMYYDKPTRTLIVGTVSQGFFIIRKNFINSYNAPDQTIFHALAPYSAEE